jgi:hypothetical protein
VKNIYHFIANQILNAIMKIVLILFFIVGIGFQLYSQNEIHLLGCDSVLKCKKIKVHKGFIGYTAADTG